MRHRRKRRQLSLKSSHRKALLRNLLRNLVAHKRIHTTVTKARVASSFADKMIQIAKQNNLQARRLLISKLGCAETADTLLLRIAPHFKDRQGGYTRVLRTGSRVGYGAETALLEFTETIPVPEKKKKEKKAKASTAKVETAPEKPKKEKEPTSKSSKAKAEPSEKDVEEGKKEGDKKGGFLSTLRKFLKGDEK